MSNTDRLLKNAALASGSLRPVRTNCPTQYIARQRQYFDPETRAFAQQVARFSSDFVEAQVQGLIQGDPTAWGTYRIRFADVVRPSSAIQRDFDDYKQFLFESAKIEYVKPGTKIVTMGSTWLVTNPENISGSSGTGIVRRCNAVWNHYDYYGNVLSEPLIVENTRANANDSDSQESVYITKGYFNVICQYNDYTRQIDTNTRMILGTAAYRVTGYSDFDTEFTGDYSTVRLLSFTVRYEEPNHVIDDMINHVAGGKEFSWEISVNAPSNMRAGGTALFSAVSRRKNKVVENTPEHPITYEWESSDESVLTIDGDGNATAVGEGTATVRVMLSQNTAQYQDFPVTVTETQDEVAFTTSVPATLGYAEKVTLRAAYFEDGEETDEAATWNFTGADTNAYTAVTEGNEAVITCFGYSDTPLTVTASYGDYTASADIILEGI